MVVDTGPFQEKNLSTTTVLKVTGSRDSFGAKLIGWTGATEKKYQKTKTNIERSILKEEKEICYPLKRSHTFTFIVAYNTANVTW